MWGGRIPIALLIYALLLPDSALVGSFSAPPTGLCLPSSLRRASPRWGAPGLRCALREGSNGIIGRREAAVAGIAAVASLWLPSRAIAGAEGGGGGAGGPGGREALFPALDEGAKRIFLCRHGETELNRLGKIQGARVDPPLNERGREQAALLGRALSTVDISFAASSPLQRARQTADIVCRSHPGLEPLESASLKEVDFGASDGLDLEQARKKTNKTYKQWMEGDLRARSPGGGESFLEVQDRQTEALRLLLSSCSENQSVLAVSHSSYLRLMLSLVLGWDLARSKAQPMDNCCLNVIDFTKDGTFVPRYINDVRHLEEAMVPA